MRVPVVLEISDELVGEALRGGIARAVREVLEEVGRQAAGPVRPLETGKLLSVREAAARMGIRQVTMRLWIARKRVAVVRMGRRVFVAREEVARLKAQGVRPRKRRATKKTK